MLMYALVLHCTTDKMKQNTLRFIAMTLENVFSAFGFWWCQWCLNRWVVSQSPGHKTKHSTSWNGKEKKSCEASCKLQSQNATAVLLSFPKWFRFIAMKKSKEKQKKICWMHESLLFRNLPLLEGKGMEGRGQSVKRGSLCFGTMLCWETSSSSEWFANRKRMSVWMNCGMQRFRSSQFSAVRFLWLNGHPPVTIEVPFDAPSGQLHLF